MLGSQAVRGGGAGRLTNVQVLRGVAVLLVLSAHSIDASELVAGRWGVASVGYIENFGAFGVDLFFVISGFVMAFSVSTRNGARSAGDFLIRRWIRIAPPYFVASAIGLIALAVAYGIVPTFHSYANTVLFLPVFDTQVYSSPLLPVGWTLSFEFTFYALVGVLLVVRLAHRPGVLALAMLVLVLVGHFVPGKAFIVGWLTNPILLEFAAGIAIYAAWKRGLVARLWPVACLLGVTALGALVWQLVYGYGAISEQQFITDGALSLRRATFWGLPAAGIFLAVIALPSARRSALAHALLAIGDASYSVYLIHLPMIALFATAVPLLWPAMPGIAVVFASMILGLGGGVIFHRVVEHPLGARLSGAYDKARGVWASRPSRSAFVLVDNSLA